MRRSIDAELFVTGSSGGVLRLAASDTQPPAAVGMVDIEGVSLFRCAARIVQPLWHCNRVVVQRSGQYEDIQPLGFACL